MLRPWLATLGADEPLWPGKWAQQKRASKFLPVDLSNARQTWLETADGDEQREAMNKTDFLKYRDRDDQQADFHALRHTFLSRLGRSGASAKVMQRLARHSTVELTIGRYTHAGLFDLSAAVNKLPARLCTKNVGWALPTTNDGGMVGSAHLLIAFAASYHKGWWNGGQCPPYMKYAT